MDKKYYYRMLGLQEGATRSQIDAAYQKRMKCLQSPDYADDPEYAHKKMVQTKNAYKVLTGAAAPATRVQRENHFERIKDALDGGEDSVRKEKRRIHRKHTIDDSPIGSLKGLTAKLGDAVQHVQDSIQDISYSLKDEDSLDSDYGSDRGEYNSAFDNVYDSGERLNGSGKVSKPKGRKEMGEDGVKALISIAVLVIGLFGGVISSCESSDDYYGTPEYEYVMEEDYYNENLEDPYSSRIAAMNAFGDQFDYYSGLDYDSFAEYESLIRWDSADDDDVEAALDDLAYYLDAPAYDYRELIYVFTGDEEYLDLEIYDTAQCVDIITSWMCAPSFEDVAGATEPYYELPIITYADYLRYLNSVIAEQGPDIWGEEL